jgi:hypothetical protein
MPDDRDAIRLPGPDRVVQHVDRRFFELERFFVSTRRFGHAIAPLHHRIAVSSGAAGFAVRRRIFIDRLHTRKVGFARTGRHA